MNPKLADEDYCYVTTTGRVSGEPHTVEIWFGAAGDTVYVLAGGRHDADFVKNAKRQPAVVVRVGAETTFAARARIVTDSDEDARVRRLLLEKYAPPRHEGDLDEWGRTALGVAFDLTERR